MGFVLVLVGGSLVCLSWSNEQLGLTNSQPKEAQPESVRHVVIPSSLEAAEVLAQFVPYLPPWGEKITGKDYSFWGPYFEITPNEGFTYGVATSWHGAAYWIKKDGTKVEGPDDPLGFILSIAVLKYEKSESAKEDYDKIGTKQEFIDLNLEGVSLKTKVGIPPAIGKRPYMMNVEPEQCRQNLLWSNNFIIYAFGLREAVDDAITRLIDQYGEIEEKDCRIG